MVNGLMITINGKQFPAPDTGLEFVIESYVDGGKNANMEFIGQKVGRDQNKIDSLQWYHLDAVTWSELLQEFARFEINVTFPNMVTNTMQTIVMYPGNRSARPNKVVNGMPVDYLMCKCNIIDCGRVS